MESLMTSAKKVQSNKLIPKNLQTEYHKINETKDVFYFLNKSDLILNDNFYIILDSAIKKIKGQKPIHTYGEVLNYMDNMLDALLPVSALHRSLSSFYELIFYPLFAKSYRTPKKLSDFNIDVKFIKSILTTNLHNLRNNTEGDNEDDLCVKLTYFRFTNSIKLSELITTKSGGVKQVYDKNYRFKSIIMADGEELKIPKKITEIKRGNKRISKVSK